MVQKLKIRPMNGFKFVLVKIDGFRTVNFLSLMSFGPTHLKSHIFVVLSFEAVSMSSLT